MPVLQPVSRDLLTAQDVARRLSIGVRTLWRMVALGKLPQPIRYTRKLVRWKTTDIDRYIESLSAVGSVEAPVCCHE
ncbi:MAG TPA: helix-turn-helix domain-containing protein [Gemmataceae bacterium]|nr:helix-turn-helix domain-containing protein [Gemmataceae bacterium]